MARFLFDNVLDGDLEYNGLARQFWVIIFWERDVDVTRFATRHTNNLIFKTWDELTTAQCQFIPSGRATIELDAIFESGKVNYNCVAIFCNIICIAVACAQQHCAGHCRRRHNFFHRYCPLAVSYYTHI